MTAGLVIAAGSGAYVLRGHPLPWAPRTGSITFETVPAGIEVFVGENSIGRSPVTVSLAPGTYDARLGEGTRARSLKIAVTAGLTAVQHYEMPITPAPPSKGALRIQTDPDNLVVLFDGAEKGVSPLTIDAVDAGDHEIAVLREQSVIKEIVHIVAGEKTSVVVSAAPQKANDGAVTAGWLSIKAPIPLKVTEGRRLIGSTDVDRLMLPSGDHDLEFADDRLGFRVARRVNIVAGKTTTLSAINLPNGSLSLNAIPWADVYVDGSHVGQTPLGNVSLPIGTHEVVFRHPDLGERKETVTLTTLAPARLGVDLRKQ